jgi:hypothetical protein
MMWVVSRFRLKAPPGISSSCISPLTSSGQRNRTSWASQPQKSATLSPQPGGKPRKVHKNMWWHWGGGDFFLRKSFRLLDNVRKCGRAGQATDENIMGRRIWSLNLSLIWIVLKGVLMAQVGSSERCATLQPRAAQRYHNHRSDHNPSVNTGRRARRRRITLSIK